MNFAYGNTVLDKTGIVKTVYTSKGAGIWDVYRNEEEQSDIDSYLKLAAYFGTEVTRINRVDQKHTDRIRIVTDDLAGEGVTAPVYSEPCDGMITDRRGIVLATVEADCTPVYLLDPVHGAIGMVHSGWRGTAAGIVLRAMEKMNECYGTKPADLMVAMGPAICGGCYEVGEELISAMKNVCSDEETRRIFRKKDEVKYTLDVSLAVRYTLMSAGVRESAITMPPCCTYENIDIDSYRREKGKKGRMLTAIMLK
ncbi:MAG: peptidoglycan editing factor PgeF [Lachnospiraceae bacterium]|nr:peptidoglycan editing factor PgeF [Lachnospiraceae bacterium]